MMKYRWLLTLTLLGCAAQSLTPTGTLVVKSQIQGGAISQTLRSIYTKDSVDRLTLELFAFSGGSFQTTGLQKTLLNAQLDNPIVFTNLKGQTTYRIKAYAYASGSVQINTSDPNSYVDITVVQDDRPTVGVLPIKLDDQPFDGRATSSINLIPGVYLPVGSESMIVPGVEGIVTTLAGTASMAFLDGTGSSARFMTPTGLTIDGQGNLYTVEWDSHSVRKITPSGVVTTIAGNGSYGYANGNGTAAMFYHPHDIICDGSGNLFVADSYNNCIRKIDSNGVVTTWAGNISNGSSNGVGTNASFACPIGITIDAAKNLYVADAGNNLIRKIAPDRAVTTFAGSGRSGFTNGVGTSVAFTTPSNMVFDALGNLYLGERGNDSIRKITPEGVVSTFAGAGVAGYYDGVASIARFSDPSGMVFDKYGNMYVADRINNAIRKISPNGMVTTIAGNGVSGEVDGTGYSARLSQPYGLVQDAQGNLFFADISGFAIRKLR